MDRYPTEREVFGIGSAARLTGIPVETLRKWEQRYGLPRAARTEGGHRKYSHDDLTYLRALKELVATGLRIGSLADLDREQVLGMLHAQSAAAAPPAPRDYMPEFRPTAAFVDVADAILEHAQAFDAERVEDLLSQPLLANAPLTVIEGLYLPLLSQVGALWHDGLLDIGVEHLVEKLITSRLHNMLAMRRGPSGGPSAVLACLPGDIHEVGLLAAAVTLRELGFRLAYLGANLPLHDLRIAVSARRPNVIVLAAMVEPSESVLTTLSADARTGLLGEATIVVGGAAAPCVCAHVAEAVHCASLDDLPRLVAAHVPARFALND